MSQSDQNHQSGCCDTCQAQNSSVKSTQFRLVKYRDPLISFILLSGGLALEHLIRPDWFADPIRFIWYLAAYLPVGYPVLKEAVTNLKRGDLFTEFFLMGIATLGAFFIGEYAEGVAVMLFYSVGEMFQHAAVRRARENIRALLDVRPETAHVIRNDSVSTVHPKEVKTGETIRVRPGERVPLDGILLTERSAFDTSALTGESKPRTFHQGDEVLSGMVNQHSVIEIEVVKTYENSSITRILKMVQDASSRKAKTELFIRSFARVYTPGVVLLATLLVILPAFFVTPYVFDDWLYRGLVFLVISCPCALVISIPLGYFGGIGAASKNGILVKGSNYLDALKSVRTVVFDKTGTLTKGTFTVQEIDLPHGNESEILPVLLAVEEASTHPVAKAITGEIEGRVSSVPEVNDQEEIPGYGVRAFAEGKEVLVGSEKLMKREEIDLNGYPKNGNAGDSLIYVAVNGVHEGTIRISDQVKEDSSTAIRYLRKLGIQQSVMLSGDRQPIADKVGEELGIDYVYAELLPDQKAHKLDEIKDRFPGVTAYVGDGINDAPVIALSDVGIAMGAMGSDVAIETADVVIQTDQPSKIATAIKIAKATRNIVWQNIGLALGIKILVLALGALGVATLWEAVFADVGVALLAVLNAIRIQKMDFG